MVKNKEEFNEFLFWGSVIIGTTLLLGLSFYLLIFMIPLMLIACLIFCLYLGYVYMVKKFNFPTISRKNKTDNLNNEVIDVDFEIIENTESDDEDY